jgi:hypothetical protein
MKSRYESRRIPFSFPSVSGKEEKKFPKRRRGAFFSERFPATRSKEREWEVARS